MLKSELLEAMGDVGFEGSPGGIGVSLDGFDDHGLVDLKGIFNGSELLLLGEWMVKWGGDDAYVQQKLDKWRSHP